MFLFCFDTSVSSSHSILQFLSLQCLLQEKKKGSAKFLKRIQKQAFSSLPREKLKHFRKLKKIKKKNAESKRTTISPGQVSDKHEVLSTSWAPN